jgi:RHS repeat-associated protein
MVTRLYYSAGGQRVAVRVSNDATPANNGLFYLLTDHLGSTSITANGTTGALVSEMRYKPWGETRWSSGTTPTSKHFTGQIEDAGIGLYFYGSRFYDPAVGRFTQADTIVPGARNPQADTTSVPGVENPQALNRYSYVLNSPLNHVDSTGHCLDACVLEFIAVTALVVAVAIIFAPPDVRKAGASAFANVVEGFLESIPRPAANSLPNGINVVFASRGDGGAASAAQHLSMLLGGATVGGYGPHPGDPDPYGRDRNHNAEGLRNSLKGIQENMRSGESIQEFLARQNWTEEQVTEFMQATNDYLGEVLDTDVMYNGVEEELATELRLLASDLGITP